MSSTVDVTEEDHRPPDPSSDVRLRIDHSNHNNNHNNDDDDVSRLDDIGEEEDYDYPDFDSATTPLSSSLSSSYFPVAPSSRRGVVAFPAPPDHLLLSILVLFLCCPFGAVAVIKSLEAQVTICDGMERRNIN